MVNIPAAQIEAVENGVAVSRHTAVVGKPDRPSPELNGQDHRDQFQSLLDRAGLDRAPRPHSDDAEGPGLSHQEPHPHLRHARQRSCIRRRSTGIRTRRSITASSRIPARSIRSARCDQLPEHRRRLHARHAAKRACSARTCASIPRAACACRTCANWSTGCCAIRPAGPRAEIDAASSNPASATTPSSPSPCRCTGSTSPPGRRRRRRAVPRRHLQPRRARPIRHELQGLTAAPPKTLDIAPG